LFHCVCLILGLRNEPVFHWSGLPSSHA
jgi:hypothetical protein